MGSIGRYWRFQRSDSYEASERRGSRVTHGEGMGQSLAKLGFIVIKLNSLGTAQRSKAMKDYFYGNVIDNGLPAMRRSWDYLVANLAGEMVP